MAKIAALVALVALTRIERRVVEKGEVIEDEVFEVGDEFEVDEKEAKRLISKGAARIADEEESDGEDEDAGAETPPSGQRASRSGSKDKPRGGGKKADSAAPQNPSLVVE